MAKEKNNESLTERMKKMPLYHWGLISIFAGIFSNLLVGLMIQSADMRRAEERAAQLGAAIAGGLFVVIGIALIIAYFFRRKSS